MTKVQGRIFVILHAVGSLALIVLLSLLTGCFRDDPLPEEKKFEVPGADVVNAVLLNSPEPSDIKKGEYVWTGHYMRTFTNPFVVVDQNTYEVKKKEYGYEETDDGLITYNIYDLKQIQADENSNIIQIKEGQCRLILSPLIGWYPQCKIALPPFQDQLYDLDDGSEGPMSTSWISPFNVQTNGVVRATKFYNLKVIPQLVSLPAEMVKLGKCMGFEDCKVPATLIEFAMDSGPQSNGLSGQQHFKSIISKQLPYLASTLESCVSFQAMVESTPALIEDCTRVLNYDVGTD